MNSLINRALCTHRDKLEADYNEHMVRARKFNKDNGQYNEGNYVVSMHKALCAANEWHEVNALLNVTGLVVGAVLDLDMVNALLPVFAERAEVIYAEAEAMCESRAALAFERNAYGID